MNRNLVARIVNAVLYEGYMLYPYRPTAIKNRQRWNFGVVYPQAYSLAQRAPRPDVDAWCIQTECLVQGHPHSALTVHVRCLHLLTQDAQEMLPPQHPEETIGRWCQVETLAVDGQLFHTREEVVAREVTMAALTLEALAARPQRLEFRFPASQQTEILRNASSRTVGALRRQQRPVTAVLEVAATAVGAQMFTLTVRIMNLTPCDQASVQQRALAMLSALVSTHTILQIHDGAFLSLLDPPPEYSRLAAACRNVGTWPVLVGEVGERDCLLSSPIILYDYPQVAPESPGDLFDATEIDELLTLRILTLTDAEKREIGSADARTRQLLERTAALPMDHLQRLHGCVRTLRPLPGAAR